MESQIKELKKGNDQLSVTPTIIIKSVGKAATSFFPSFSRPWPNVEQNYNVCAGNCSLIS